jgi:hypothetical protein
LIEQPQSFLLPHKAAASEHVTANANHSNWLHVLYYKTNIVMSERHPSTWAQQQTASGQQKWAMLQARARFGGSPRLQHILLLLVMHSTTPAASHNASHLRSQNQRAHESAKLLDTFDSQMELLCQLYYAQDPTRVPNQQRCMQGVPRRCTVDRSATDTGTAVILPAALYSQHCVGYNGNY